MGRFFGPTPNVIAGSGFFRGSAAAGGFNWTSRGQPLTGDGTFVAYGNGVHVAVAGQTLWRTTDNGVTWAQVDATSLPYQQIAYVTGNIWVVVSQSSPGHSRRSVNNGLTWAAAVAIAGSGNTSAVAAVTGGGTIAAGGGVGNGTGTDRYAVSSDNAQTWAAPNLTTIGTFFSMLYNGTEFVASCRTAASGGNDAGVAISTDLGQTWPTQIDLSAVNNYIEGLNFDPVSGLYIVATNDQDTIRVANSPAGLATAPDTPTGLSDGGSNYCQIGGGKIFVFGVAGGVSLSTDGGHTFTAGNLNFSGGNAAIGCSYNPVSNVFVAVGANGNVATFP